jgi:hypothetical protein
VAESALVIGQYPNRKSGQNTESPVEKPDERAGNQASEPSWRNGKVGDYPEGIFGNGAP